MWLSNSDQNHACFISYSYSVGNTRNYKIKHKVVYFSLMNPFNRNMQLVDHEMFFVRFNRVLQCDMTAQCLSNCVRSTKTIITKQYMLNTQNSP